MSSRVAAYWAITPEQNERFHVLAATQGSMRALAESRVQSDYWRHRLGPRYWRRRWRPQMRARFRAHRSGGPRKAGVWAPTECPRMRRAAVKAVLQQPARRKSLLTK